MPKGFKPPLEVPELQDMRKRNPGNTDVWLLQWEVKRLQHQLTEATCIIREYKEGSVDVRYQVEPFLKGMETEPCIIERDKFVRETLDSLGPQKKRILNWQDSFGNKRAAGFGPENDDLAD